MRFLNCRGLAALVAGAVLALACAPRLQAADDAKAVDDYNFAAWLFNNGKYDMAAESYQAFLKNHAGHEKAAEARFGLAQSFFHQNQFKEAVEEYETLRKQHPDFGQMPEMLFQLGQSRVGLDQYEEAGKLFADLRARFPEHYLADWALARQGACLVILGKPADAEPLLRVFLDKYEKPAQPGRKSAATEEMIKRLAQAEIKAENVFLDLIERTSFHAALAQFNQERFNEAQESFRAFQNRYPKSALLDEARFREAQSMYRQEAFEQAAEAYKSVAGGQGEFAEAAAFERGLAFHKAGKLKEASAAFAEMAARFPDGAQALKARLYAGTLLFDAGDYAAAIERLKPLCEEKDIADEAAYWTGMSLLKSGRHADAELRFVEAAQAYPKSALLGDMQLGLADARLAINKNEEAAAAFREYARLRKDAEQAPRALYSAAAALHRAEKHAASDEVCAEFLKVYPQHELVPQVLFLSAENRFLQKAYDQAAARHKELLAHADTPADLTALAHFRLAWIHRYAKRNEEALEELSEVDGAAAGPTVAGEVYYLVGICCFDLQNHSEAAQAFEAYLSSADTSRFGDDALLKLGISRAKQAQPKAAQEAFTRLLKDHPNSELVTQALYQLAESCYELKEYDKAIEHYGKAAGHQPPAELTPYAVFGMALCRYDKGEWEAAAKDFSRIPEQFKDSDLVPQALYRKGISLMKLKKWDEAESAFRALATATPKHELARASMVLAGTCLQEQQNWAEAAKTFRTALDAYPPDKDQARVFYELGWSLREAGNEVESLAAFQSLADGFPTDPLAADAFFYLAEAKYKEPAKPEQPDETVKRLEAARALFAQVLALSKDKRLDDKALYRIGWCDWLNKKYASAAAEFDRLWRDYSGSELTPDALFHAGQAYARIGDHEAAAKRFKDLLDNPKYSHFKYLPEARLGLGEASLALNQPAEAEKVLSAWLKDYAGHAAAAQAHFMLGRAKYDRKDYPGALESFGTVPTLTRSELAAQAQFYSGQVLHAQGKHKEAVMAYLRVQALYPDVAEWNAAAMFEKAKCLEALGDNAEAVASYKEIVEKYKGTKWAELAAGRLQ